MMYLWSPTSYGSSDLRVRRTPDAVICESTPAACNDQGMLYTMHPNGGLAGMAEDALAKLEAAGPRGGAALGAVAGLVFSGWKAAIIGGGLGYFAGKYIVNIASKALTVVSAASAVEKATS
jgi:hypothetical protein